MFLGEGDMGVYGIAVLSFFFCFVFLKGPYLCLEKEKEKKLFCAHVLN